MTLYSLSGAAPTSLPREIVVPDAGSGRRVRTPPFTIAMIAAAGYAEADDRPDPVDGIPAWWTGSAWASADAKPSWTAEHQAAPVWDDVTKQWDVPRAIPLATRQALMKASASVRFRAVIAAGTVVGGITIDLSAEGFERLGQAHAALVAGGDPISAVTVRGENIDLPNAAAAADVISAARAHYLAAASTERALCDAVAAAEDHDALDLIAIDAGTIDGNGGWPT